MTAYFEDGSEAFAQLDAIADTVYAMIESAGLRNFFYALEAVCDAKAERLRRQDPTTARQWEKMAETMRYGAAFGEGVDLNS
jgi:hypothetical protein